MKIKLIYLLPFFFFFYGCVNENDIKELEEKTFKSITNEVVLFEYTPDNDNNSYKLRYDIKFTNPNNFAVNGYSSVTINYDGIIVTPIKRVPVVTFKIEANSNYTESFDIEKKLTPVEVKINSIKIENVKFVIPD